MPNKRKFMCKTCIYRTNDKEFLSLPKHTNHPCHEDDFGPKGCNNPNPKLCFGNKGERGQYIGDPMFAEHWKNNNAKEIMESSRRIHKERYKYAI